MNEKGFTLLEALLALLLVASVLVVLLEGVSVSLVAGGDNENSLVATELAGEKMEEIRNTAYASISSQAKAVVSGFPAFQREVVVTTPLTNLKQVAVNVYWTHKASELSVGLVTYAFNV